MSPAAPPLPAVLLDETTGVVLARHLESAATWLTRFRGLMLRRPLAPGEGLLIFDCRSIHMMFMRGRIDAVFVDGDLRVRAVARRVRPWIGFAWGGRSARAVIELPPGAADAVQAGDRLALTAGDAVPDDGHTRAGRQATTAWHRQPRP